MANGHLCWLELVHTLLAGAAGSAPITCEQLCNYSEDDRVQRSLPVPQRAARGPVLFQAVSGQCIHFRA